MCPFSSWKSGFLALGKGQMVEFRDEGMIVAHMKDEEKVWKTERFWCGMREIQGEQCLVCCARHVLDVP